MKRPVPEHLRGLLARCRFCDAETFPDQAIVVSKTPPDGVPDVPDYFEYPDPYELNGIWCSMRCLIDELAEMTTAPESEFVEDERDRDEHLWDDSFLDEDEEWD